MGGGLVLVLILVFISSRKKSGGGSSIYEGGVNSGDKGQSSDDTGQSGLNDIQFQNMLSGLEAQLESTTNMYESQFSGLESQLESRTNLYESQLENTSAFFSSQIGTLQDSNTELNSILNDMITKQATTTIQNSTVSPIYTSDIYEPVQPVVVDTTNRTVYGVSNPYVSAGQEALKTPQPNFGYGGIDYNATTTTTAQKIQMQDSSKRLAVDTSYKESEISRAKAVQQARGMAGLDTSAQDKYLKTLLAKK